MRRLKWPILILLPLAALLLHMLAMVTLEGSKKEWFLSEHGPTELLTSALFAFAAGLAVVHMWRFWRVIPALYRAAVIGFALACAFVAIEEISYGQSLLSYHSPAWFERHNYQEEFNLHNLAGDKPSRFMRRAGEIGLPIFAIGAPLFRMLKPLTRRPGRFGYHLLPGWELLGALGVSIVIRLIWQWRKAVDQTPPWTDGLSEVQELMWAFAAAVSIAVIHARLRPDRTSQAAAPEGPAAGTTA